MGGEERARERRQGVWNWLALAALVALGIVWAPEAPPSRPQERAGARSAAAPARLAGARVAAHAAPWLRRA